MLQFPRRPVVILLALLFVAALLLPQFAGIYGVKFATRVMVLAILVVSLDFLIGVTGLVSFGHAMFFGLGAYGLYFLSPISDPANALIAFPMIVAATALAAAVVGAFAVLTRGFYFIMVTLAFGQMLFSLFHDTRLAGGSDGAYVNVKPVIAVAGTTLLDLGHRVSFYYFCLAALVAAYFLLLALARTPFGRVLQGIRFNEARMSALGFNTYAYKLLAFVAAGAVAGFAGALFAAIDGYVAPDLFGWRQSGTAIMMVVLGGVGTLFGPILGALMYAGLEEVLKTASLVGPWVADHWSLYLGAVLIAAVLAAPRGIAQLFERADAVAAAPEAGQIVIRKRAPGRAKSLAVAGLSRSFGGLVAVDGVSLELAPNKVHGIIGPNGAGKTTFINLLSGALRPSAGRIRLDNEDIAGRPAHRVARRGLGRSYQRTNILLPFTVRENCLLAAQARHPAPWRLRRSRFAAEEGAAVAFALDALGLGARADTRALHLSHGEQRQLEIAMLIASGARVLVLDEPLAGMGNEETGRVTALLRELAVDHTIVLIEHDMDAIFAAADTLTVLVEGRLLAHGAPETIRSNAAVREAYLGRWGNP
ncbi:MAG TPA: branched-chain amino acid ABC transporter ATP-binding protein/permease [Xanthobacteraceae bacterium]|nr:branched-chain amino acid ABC transporter ATP-binding protein/permease [Xanthobacteraceae bacterium]